MLLLLPHLLLFNFCLTCQFCQIHSRIGWILQNMNFWKVLHQDVLQSKPKASKKPNLIWVSQLYSLKQGISSHTTLVPSLWNLILGGEFHSVSSTTWQVAVRPHLSLWELLSSPLSVHRRPSCRPLHGEVSTAVNLVQLPFGWSVSKHNINNNNITSNNMLYYNCWHTTTMQHVQQNAKNEPGHGMTIPE